MFKVIFKQHGGCDYTIACGTKVQDLKASNMEQAYEEVKALIKDDYGVGYIQKATIIHVSDLIEYNVKQLEEEIEREDKKREEEAIVKSELAVLKRLQAKYGGKV